MVINHQKNNPFGRMTFTYDNCFLCGCQLTKENYTVEHIIPKWLQRKFDLWNKELILLNDTSIKYKNLTIPCCKNCNNILSKKIEKPIMTGVTQGYDQFVQIDEHIIFQWLNKISYGFLYKELSLKENLSDKNSNPIYRAELLKEHEMQYLFLKSIISDTTFVNNAWSILVFKIDPHIAEPYWASDRLFLKTFCIRMADIGIIAHLMDNGYSKDFFLEHEPMKELLGKTLHPIQFAELCSAFNYKASLFLLNPSYTTLFNLDFEPITIISHELNGIGYAEWDQKTYAHTLASDLVNWGCDFDGLFRENSTVYTFLRNEDGTFKDLLSNDRQ